MFTDASWLANRGMLVMKGDDGRTVMHDVCEVCGYMCPSPVTVSAQL